MAIDEAINHALEVSKNSYGNCAKNHRQLAAWLKRLKELEKEKEIEK